MIVVTDRSYWVHQAERLARPVLTALAQGRLKATMPVEDKRHEGIDRSNVSHLEAICRLLAGIAPWLETAESPLCRELSDLARRAIAMGVDPRSPDYLNFDRDMQPLVDGSFLAHAMLRAPNVLWKQLDARTQEHVLDALRLTRSITPSFNNWLLFCGMIEAFFAFAGQWWDTMRVDYAIRQHLQWYKGDSIYGDGPHYHWDHYNSYVIQPMLLDVLTTVSPLREDWNAFREPVLQRAQRYAIIQERLIAPDGSFPAVGRSITYRCGAFQHLAQMALQERLPAELKPAQVRSALSAVIARTLDAPGTFDDAGWLRIGLAGHQPSLGEGYISTGSLYLCSTALLPLGLPATHEFWSAEPLPYSAQRLWRGEDLPADHRLHEG